jgi:trimeric autotransporter adhesin
MKRNLVVPLFLVMIFTSNRLRAQFPYFNSFKTSDASEIVLGGDAKLTSGSEDPVNSGYLRLTPAQPNKRGFAYIEKQFPSTQGIKVEFEFNTWGGTLADGIAFFLFDPSNGFEIGQYGGALGYAQNNNTGTGLGMKNGFLAVGLDEYGNFGAATETKNGGFRDYTNQEYTSSITANGLITVRGAVGPNGERDGATAYPFLGGKISNAVWGGTKEPLASAVLSDADKFNIATNRRGQLETDQDYRKVRMDIERVVGTGRLKGQMDKSPR